MTSTPDHRPADRLTARFRIFLEYDGTRYSGWQIQKNARTVQGEIHEALHAVFATRDFEFQGSGRTDAGVHALMQVAHLAVETVLAPEIIRMKLNDQLPPDINILEVEKAPARFHARHDATSRTYLYRISRRRTAFGKKYVWWVKDRLDVGKMRHGARLFAGMNDLQSFTEDDPAEKSTKVKIDRIAIEEEGDIITVRITGSHFIWKLVRRIVGVLVEVGRGKLTDRQVETFLRTRSGEPARCTAPPSGLFLESVAYQGQRPDVTRSHQKPVHFP